MKIRLKVGLYCLLGAVILHLNQLCAQEQKLFLEGFNDANLNPGSGMLQMGETDGPNMIMDRNEILTRNNGTPSSLFLNIEGGEVKTGSSATPANFWATGFIRSGTDAENVRFKFHHETGTVSDAGGTATLNLNLPAGTGGTDLIMVQVTKEGPSSNLLPVSILTRNNFAVTIGEILPNGTVYHIGIIYVE